MCRVSHQSRRVLARRGDGSGGECRRGLAVEELHLLEQAMSSVSELVGMPDEPGNIGGFGRLLARRHQLGDLLAEHLEFPL